MAGIQEDLLARAVCTIGVFAVHILDADALMACDPVQKAEGAGQDGSKRGQRGIQGNRGERGCARGVDIDGAGHIDVLELAWNETKGYFRLFCL
jgi:hypothetical protein